MEESLGKVIKAKSVIETEMFKQLPQIIVN